MKSKQIGISRVWKEKYNSKGNTINRERRVQNWENKNEFLTFKFRLG